MGYIEAHNYIIIIFLLYSAIQSFEVVVYLFAQQLSLNETQNFTVNSLTVVSELVRSIMQNFNIVDTILHSEEKCSKPINYWKELCHR